MKTNISDELSICQILETVSHLITASDDISPFYKCEC